MQQAHEESEWVIDAPVLARDSSAKDEEYANEESRKLLVFGGAIKYPLVK